MKRTSKSISITLILAFMLLACLLMQAVGVTGAWFTAGGTKVVINIAGLGVKLYQDGVEIDPEDNTKQTYLNLEGEIAPDAQIPVNLTLSTSEPSGVYVRYKFEVYALGQTATKITTTDIGYLQYVENTKIGFDIEAVSGYYYLYATNGQEAKLTRDMGAVSIMEKFSISSAQFENNNFNGETIKVIVTVECQDTAFTSGT